MGKNWNNSFYSIIVDEKITENNMILIYVVCTDQKEAVEISKAILNLRLCACTNILPGMTSYYFWPPTERNLVEDSEVVLLIKTLESKYEEIESVVLKLHSYENPSIFSIKVEKVSGQYLNWLKNEVAEK